jgi:hypothetical protein
VFDEASAFRRELRALLRAGFDWTAITVLAENGTVSDHFGGRIPEAAELADRPHTPREDLYSGGALSAAIHFIAETVSTIGTVGGPVGLASAARTRRRRRSRAFLPATWGRP